MILYTQNTTKGIYVFMYEMLWATSHDHIQYDFMIKTTKQLSNNYTVC